MYLFLLFSISLLAVSDSKNPKVERILKKIKRKNNDLNCAGHYDVSDCNALSHCAWASTVEACEPIMHVDGADCAGNDFCVSGICKNSICVPDPKKKAARSAAKPVERKTDDLNCAGHYDVSDCNAQSHCAWASTVDACEPIMHVDGADCAGNDFCVSGICKNSICVPDPKKKKAARSAAKPVERKTDDLNCAGHYDVSDCNAQSHCAWAGIVEACEPIMHVDGADCAGNKFCVSGICQNSICVAART